MSYRNFWSRASLRLPYDSRDNLWWSFYNRRRSAARLRLQSQCIKTCSASRSISWHDYGAVMSASRQVTETGEEGNRAPGRGTAPAEWPLSVEIPLREQDDNRKTGDGRKEEAGLLATWPKTFLTWVRCTAGSKHCKGTVSLKSITGLRKLFCI